MPASPAWTFGPFRLDAKLLLSEGNAGLPGGAVGNATVVLALCTRWLGLTFPVVPR